MAVTFDPRLTPARPDLAASFLRGKVEAARFADGDIRVAIDAQAPLRRNPSHQAPLVTEILKGERVRIFETNEEGWCWGQLESDGYVGYLPENALTKADAAVTHKVSALRTFVFAEPDIKTSPIQMVPFGAHLTVTRQDERFAILAEGGFVPAVHVRPLADRETDFVAVAERFLGTPYLWGGKTNFGIDCSGLVQIALAACGIACPRDSDLQENALGTAQNAGNLSTLKRGDLVFWKGHVGIMRDAAMCLHANAFHMAVAIEPLVESAARIAAGGSSITAIKRL